MKPHALDGRLVAAARQLDAVGLLVRGVASLTPDDPVRALPVCGEMRSVVLIGHAGSHFWPHFARSPEADDGAPDPLDRWSRRIAAGVAADLDGLVVMPSDGPPYAPFQQWAVAAETIHRSPLGLLIHPEYGLWHGYRAAILLRDDLVAAADLATAAPCETCAGRPCLTACPVGAFSAARYDVTACRQHLDAPASAACWTANCLARAACPVGREYAYVAPHATFHMRAFAGSEPQRPSGPANTK